MLHAWLKYIMHASGEYLPFEDAFFTENLLWQTQ